MLANFSIVLPGGCNAKCDFCTDDMSYQARPDWLLLLHKAIHEKLPESFRQVSITGGEPGISPLLSHTLQMVSESKRFNKVVLTTNGTNILDNVALYGRHVHHLNISRHAIGYEKNVEIFKNKRIADDDELRMACNELGKYGTDVNLNMVYCKDNMPPREFVLDFIEYAKSINATKVTFRYDQAEDSLAPTPLEQEFDDYHRVEEGGCPVCRSHTQLINGMYVTFKASYLEPSNELENKDVVYAEPYELIFGREHMLTTDWEGKRPYLDLVDQIAGFIEETKKELQSSNEPAIVRLLDVERAFNKAPDVHGPIGSSSCGSSGCSSIHDDLFYERPSGTVGCGSVGCGDVCSDVGTGGCGSSGC